MATVNKKNTNKEPATKNRKYSIEKKHPVNN